MNGRGDFAEAQGLDKKAEEGRGEDGEPQQIAEAPNIGGLGAPGELGGSFLEVDVAGEVEEVVAQAVEVGQDDGGDLGVGVLAEGVVEGDYAALGAAAYCACDVGVACGAASAGEDEGSEGRKLFFETVDFVFDGFYVGFAQAFGSGGVGEVVGGGGGVGGEVCTDVEELVLDVVDEVDGGGVHIGDGGEEAQVGVEFVDSAVCFEAFVGFAYALAAYEGCCAGVAGAGVNFHS